MKAFFFLLCLSAQMVIVKANTIKDSIVYPEIGDKCPEFVFNSIDNFGKDKVSLDDLKGRWVILDLWSSSCASCVHAFPRVNALQRKYKDKVQVLLIGYDDDRIRPMFRRFKEKENLDLPCAYDTTLFSIFDVGSVPFTVVIDTNGIIRAITADLDEEKIGAILAGGAPSMKKAYRLHDAKRTTLSPFPVNKNNDVDSNFAFQSVFSRYNYTIPISYLNSNLEDCIGILGKKGFEVSGVDLSTLYRFAYFGKDGYSYGESLYGQVYNKPILELDDSSDFVTHAEKGLFCYSISFPTSKSAKGEVMKMMQNDLLSYFGYTVKVEDRSVPYWKVTATDESRKKLATRSTTRYFKGLPHIGFIARDVSIKLLMSRICADHNDQIFIDETGIQGNIDIDMSDCFFLNLMDIKRALRNNGLDLVQGHKIMRAIVIQKKSL